MGKKGAKLTQAATDICSDIVETLAQLGDIRSKKMFGGHGIFERGTMFALVNSEAELFLKVSDTNRAQFEAAGSEQHGKMPYFAVPGDVLEDPDMLRDWAKISIKIAHSTKKK